jgi:hypothetical protein
MAAIKNGKNQTPVETIAVDPTPANVTEAKGIFMQPHPATIYPFSCKIMLFKF